MRIYVESSISGTALEAIDLVKEWKLLSDDPVISTIDDFKAIPYWLCDYTDNKGVRWKIPVPTEPGTMFIINYNTNHSMIQSYAGGCIGDYSKEIKDDKITVVVYQQDKIEDIELRSVHELLHAMELPSDDCNQYLNSFLSWWLRLWYFFKPCSNSKVQRRFYRWLLNQRLLGVM